MSLLLGIDIGTTGTKTLLITDKGDQVATAYVAYGYFSEKTGHVTQNPQDWWSAVQKTVKKCLSHCVNTEDIKAISLSTQGATLVCTDENGNELMPAIVWMDSRCENQGMNLTDIYGVDYFYKKTGLF
ncbi:MAG: FGGY family carbohydrate kinase [Oscillospiraceae bacterium]